MKSQAEVRATASQAERMHAFVSELQVLAGLVAEGTISVTVLAQCETVTAKVPSGANRLEQVTIEALLGTALCRVRRCLAEVETPVERGQCPIEDFRRSILTLRDSLSVGRPSRLTDFERTLRANHDDQSLNAARVAAELGVTTSHLSRILRKHTGRPFRWHVRRVRIEMAKTLLRSSRSSIKEIAFAVGYRRASEFDHQFRLAVGVTPTAYRAAHAPDLQ